MALTPILGGTTLPEPQEKSGFVVTREYRGGTRIMASGALSQDLVQSGVKRVFKLTWQNISTADRTTIDDEVDDLAGTTATFDTATMSETTVTLNDGLTPVEWVASLAGNGDLRWTGTLELREV